MILKASAELLKNPRLLFNLSEQKSSCVRADVTTVEIGPDHPSSWTLEQQWLRVSLCLHLTARVVLRIGVAITLYARCGGRSADALVGNPG
jgi:hypothetical protein